MEGLMFFMLFIVVGSGMVKVAKEINENEKSEILREKAYVKKKIDNMYIDNGGVINKTFKIVFELGMQELECVISEKEYKNIPENINGVLTYKGTSFLKFEPNRI